MECRHAETTLLAFAGHRGRMAAVDSVAAMAGVRHRITRACFAGALRESHGPGRTAAAGRAAPTSATRPATRADARADSAAGGAARSGGRGRRAHTRRAA